MELLAKIAASLVLTLLIKGGVALFDHWIAWWLAGLIALVVVFGGFLLIDSDDLDGAWH
jgi:integral membrane sensor domain MASE1